MLLDEVAGADVGGVEAEVVGDAVHHPLHHVHALGRPAPRTALEGTLFVKIDVNSMCRFGIL